MFAVKAIDIIAHGRSFIGSAGRVTEETIAGSALLRVDVPAVPGHGAFTRYFGNGAIYSMTIVDELIAFQAVKEIEKKAVNIYHTENLIGDKVAERLKLANNSSHRESDPW